MEDDHLTPRLFSESRAPGEVPGFHDADWLRKHGGGAMPSNVLDYLRCSPWWEEGCANDKARARGEGVEALKGYVGTQYLVAHECLPEHLIIEKLKRSSTEDVSRIAVYLVCLL